MKRVPLVILFTALITGLFLSLSTCNTEEKVKPDKTEIIKASEKAESIDTNYKAAFESLKTHSDSLEKKLSFTQRKLKITKFKLNQSQIALVALAEKKSDTLSFEALLNDCDSLKQQTLAYVAWVDSTQSIYETNIIQLQEMVATKDSQIVICTTSYAQIKGLLDDNLERERKLTEDLNTAYKSQRRKVLQNKLLAGGMLLLSGIATTLYINANK
jgi:actin-related protein